MATLHALPTAATPVERILSRFDRKQIEDFIEVAISLLDVANDPDMEEDDHSAYNGDEGDWSRPEWHTMGRHKEHSFLSGTATIWNPEDAEEDDRGEEDDPAGGNVEDEGEETYISASMPEYGEDQSLGPLNRIG